MILTEKGIRRMLYIYTILLVLLSVLPINGLNPDTPLNDIFIVNIRLDYLIHCVILIPWVFLLKQNTSVQYTGNPFRIVLLIAGGLLFSIGLEAIQYPLPYRGYNINDLLANILGAG